jgi:hypothetical protein
MPARPQPGAATCGQAHCASAWCWVVRRVCMASPGGAAPRGCGGEAILVPGGDEAGHVAAAGGSGCVAGTDAADLRRVCRVGGGQQPHTHLNMPLMWLPAATRRAHRCCAVWRCSVLRFGVVWCGVVWCGVLWCAVPGPSHCSTNTPAYAWCRLCHARLLSCDWHDAVTFVLDAWQIQTFTNGAQRLPDSQSRARDYGAGFAGPCQCRPARSRRYPWQRCTRFWT